MAYICDKCTCTIVLFFQVFPSWKQVPSSLLFQKFQTEFDFSNKEEAIVNFQNIQE